LNLKTSHIEYQQTKSFSNLVIDYLTGVEALKPFYKFEPNLAGIESAIESRKHTNTNRKLLVEVFDKQYENYNTSEKTKKNIELLLKENTFTICTAHQPNIFTGQLYFIYKIIHAIKLADDLNNKMPNNHFVPVYYMGSEDADINELGEIEIDGKKLKWQTAQTGAVGRMLIDKDFLRLIVEIENQLIVEPFGAEIISLIKSHYTLEKSIAEATFEFVHHLFNDYGLLILLPDNSNLKSTFQSIMQDDLLNQQAHKLVLNISEKFPAAYKIQTSGRPINLFYLKDNIRERIEETLVGYKVVNTEIVFSKNEMIEELNLFPERFSPNVVLRPLFQELILPNIAFIGGGSELAYWMELKSVFELYNVNYPVLLLRNSFSIIENKTSALISDLNLNLIDFFEPEIKIIKKYIRENSKLKLDLIEEKLAIENVYQNIKSVSENIDTTLVPHTEALLKNALKRITFLEKKMLRAEKKKHEAAIRKIKKIKSAIFPNGNLQERVENILPLLAKHDFSFIEALYTSSESLSKKFSFIEISE
jgi:bacillithiol biosynthesis cysteine-adding enzyme BshC